LRSVNQANVSKDKQTIRGGGSEADRVGNVRRMSQLAYALGPQLSSELGNALLFVADAVMYFTVLAALFRARHQLGIGAFFCMLGVMHFLETYLASILYVHLPLGIVASPGSTVLFTGKLMLLLLVYIREDAG